jgi:hypothetical protein
MIYDLNDNRMLSASIVAYSGVAVSGQFKVDCKSGWRLSGQAVADALIEVAHHGDSYVNIETTPIDLTTWDGSREIFDFRITPGTITAPLRRAFALTVARA